MTIALLALLACGEQAPEAPPPEDKCPEISLEGLPGEWIKVEGSSGDHKTRFQVTNEGGKWAATWIGGFFKKVRMDGELRAGDLMLTEALEGDALAAWERGERDRTRLYVQPYKQRCAMRVMEVGVKLDGGKEIEVQKGRYVEFLPFPPGQEFTFRACDEPLFLDKAATDKELADKQLKEGGAADPMAPLGEAVAAGLWTDAAADGDESCSYDMDLYFDDRPAKLADGSRAPAVPAGEVKDGQRHWKADFYAPYSGNHHLEVYRYRTCGGERELLAVACSEGILH